MRCAGCFWPRAAGGLLIFRATATDLKQTVVRSILPIKSRLMETVFDAENNVEAHMIVHLLSRHEI